MSRNEQNAANRERLERLRNPARYKDDPPAPQPATLEQRITRRAPIINKRRISLQRLDRPPRPISRALWLRTVLGGWIQQFGWAFFAFGLIFFWVFALNSEIVWALQVGKTATVQATVVGWHETGASENDAAIHATRYRFRLNGTDYEGVSYALGRHQSEGARVSVEYAIRDPQRSRIAGMRYRQFGALAVLVVIFPAIGLIMIIAGMRYGLRAAELLRIGHVAWGTVVKQSPTNVQINNQVVWKIDYEFTTRSGAIARAEARSHTPDSLLDEAQEPLLYDPDDPTRAVVLDAVPGGPEVRGDGRLVLGSYLDFLLNMILPAVAVIGHGCYIAFGLM